MIWTNFFTPVNIKQHTLSNKYIFTEQCGDWCLFQVMTIVNDNVELWCKMISRFMLLCSMSMFTTYVLYRALEIEHINKKHFLQPYNLSEYRETIDLPKKYKFILWINHKEKDGMAKFSDCRYSNCILTSNEDFISRGRIDLFDAIIVSIEGYKEDPVSMH